MPRGWVRGLGCVLADMLLWRWLEWVQLTSPQLQGWRRSTTGGTAQASLLASAEAATSLHSHMQPAAGHKSSWVTAPATVGASSADMGHLTRRSSQRYRSCMCCASSRVPSDVYTSPMALTSSSRACGPHAVRSVHSPDAMQ